MDNANLWGGYQSDEDKSLKATGGSAIVFGLNVEATVKTFAYTTKTGQNGAEGNPAIAITLVIGGSDVNTRIYQPGNKVYFKGKEVTDKNSEDYLAGLKQQIAVTKGLITHYLKALGVSESVLQANLGGATSFEQLATLACQAAAQFMPTAKIDVFAHYQATLGSTADRTFLEIPVDLSYGSFLAPSTPGVEWVETKSFPVVDEATNEVKMVEGLAYVDAANPNHYHKFVRDSFFLKSKRASEQTKASVAAAKGGSASPLARAGAATPATPTATTGQKANWGA